VSEAGVLEVSRGGFPSLGVSGVCEIVAGREKVCRLWPVEPPLLSPRPTRHTQRAHAPLRRKVAAASEAALRVDASGAKAPGPLLPPVAERFRHLTFWARAE
jgi:hypothetical protein